MGSKDEHQKISQSIALLSSGAHFSFLFRGGRYKSHSTRSFKTKYDTPRLLTYIHEPNLKMKGIKTMKQPLIKNYDELPMFINATTLAQLFGVSRASAYELMSEKDFPSFRIGKRILVTKENLVEWIEGRTKKGGN